MILLLAIILSFCMGLVIQRGGVCTVAAIHELVHKKTANRIKALIETALWVLAGELILFHAGITLPLVNIYQISSYTILGAFLLGLGATVNGACTVGTVARIGSGEWNFLAFIPGFFCGAALISWLNLPNLAPISTGSATLPQIDTWLLLIIIGLIFVRGFYLFRKGFHPYVLTIFIGVFFLGLIAINKTWSYTDLLADLAMMKHQSFSSRIALFAALITGAIVSGKYQNPNSRLLTKLNTNVVKRFIGGCIVGAATLILPGSHDSLILLYMPMLVGYAWLGFVVMVLTILSIKLIQKKLERA